MPEFKIAADFRPTGDQPQAIDALARGIGEGLRHQSLLGVTGSGKTFTMACVVEKVQRPTLVIAHNKTLAAQLATEFKEFFPGNAVEYFVSYYNYYQPEAYLPRTDTYIEKDADINDELDKLRHAATRALLTRRDTLIVASVSCIFGLGSPEEYIGMMASLRKGESLSPRRLARQLIDMQYDRNDYEPSRGQFRVRGDTLEVLPAYEEIAVRVQFDWDEVARIIEFDPVTGEYLSESDEIEIYPAKHFVTPEDKLKLALEDIEVEARGTASSSQEPRQALGGTEAGVANQVRRGDAEGGGILLRRRELLAAPIETRGWKHAIHADRLFPRGLSRVH